MKSKTNLFLLLAALITLTACWQKSLYPYYNERDVYFDEKLIGKWREAEKKDDEGMLWEITKSEEPQTYRVQITDGETKLDYDGRLFRLGGDRLLDLHSRARNVAEIPAHNLFRIDDIGVTLKARLFNMGWVSNYLKQNPNEIPHIVSRDPEHPNDPDKTEAILTAPTDQLQKFIRAHSKEEGFWSDTIEFRKLPAQ